DWGELEITNGGGPPGRGWGALHGGCRVLHRSDAEAANMSDVSWPACAASMDHDGGRLDRRLIGGRRCPARAVRREILAASDEAHRQHGRCQHPEQGVYP